MLVGPTIANSLDFDTKTIGIDPAKRWLGVRGIATMPATMTDRIVKMANVCGGRACIAGHRIRIADIVVWHEKRGYAPDEIVAMFPGLTLGDVHAALAYYFDNSDEINADLLADESWAQKANTSGPSRLSERSRA